MPMMPSNHLCQFGIHKKKMQEFPIKALQRFEKAQHLFEKALDLFGKTLGRRRRIL